MYVNGKVIPGMVGEGIKENDGRVNLSMIYLIYCKNICKCHNEPPPSTTIKKENTFYFQSNIVQTY
jgi:hypothetical protein